MKKIRCTAEQIIVHLREVKVHCSQGKTIGEVARLIGVTAQTYYRWRKKYRGMNSSDAKKPRETIKRIMTG
jgi:putative transposase